MKTTLLLASLSSLLLLGAGCEKPMQTGTPPLPTPVRELQVQTVPETQKQETRPSLTIVKPTVNETTLYRGSWFDIEYPKTFFASPTTPTSTLNGQLVVQTDEATFTSPDGAVEFFVFSPLWSGTPEQYLTIAPTEELVDEKTQESTTDAPSGKTKTHWVTVKAKDGTYFRSFVSLQTQLGTGSDLHHVFGIKYRDSASYEAYKQAYAAFKQSLTQYAD